MTEQEFRAKLAKNLISYRKLNGLTQAELAECISYSDKSVSKWERGESVPDVFILLTLSGLYDISIGELVGQSEMSKKTAELYKAQEKDRKAKAKAKKKVEERANRHKKKEKKEQKAKK